MRKITFFSSLPGVPDLYPIIPASQYRPAWIKAARDDYKEAFKKADGDKFVHLYRCPGIFDIMSTGYIVPMPWDVTIETFGDGGDFKWTIPSEDLQRLTKTQLVNGHMDNGPAKYLPSKPGSLRSFIKFNTPWYIIAPKDVKFLVIPLPYTDSHEFESVHGILDPGYSAEVNIQMRWNVMKGKHTVKAGTPMCQLIPLTNEKFELEVREATEKDWGWIHKRNYFFNFSFLFKRNVLKEMYHKYFNR